MVKIVHTIPSPINNTIILVACTDKTIYKYCTTKNDRHYFYSYITLLYEIQDRRLLNYSNRDQTLWDLAIIKSVDPKQHPGTNNTSTGEICLIYVESSSDGRYYTKEKETHL